MPNRTAWLPWMLVPLAVIGFTALWLLAAFYSGTQASFMAVVGAIDVLWVLGLSRAMAPARKAAVAVAATLAMVVATNWVLAAVYSGNQVGLSPFDAAWRLGAGHAWTLAGIANGWVDGVWVLLAIAVAAGGPFLSARLRAASAR